MLPKETGIDLQPVLSYHSFFNYTKKTKKSPAGWGLFCYHYGYEI